MFVKAGPNALCDVWGRAEELRTAFVEAGAHIGNGRVVEIAAGGSVVLRAIPSRWIPF
ncbi:hypothetical protein AKJ09_10989 [Labilithrix luteola]|uniref:Uncharacterized protein n=1 Tax=Labilithrix luteola TaxID=1391654 RepID=A0A0K1QEX9_9BACT|nr:hypothetical protein AKJ09_10989 [Labilithrix luteola]